MTPSHITSIPIIFDKSHLLTIGERLYATNLDLIRELVSNAYDADATEILIEIHPERITVSDNGSGMNENQLRQYFTIGSTEKRLHVISPILKRKRIGEFGIGKFSALAVARLFVIETWQRESAFRARLIFDVPTWSREKEDWRVPCEVMPYDTSLGNGTRVTLEALKKPLEVSQVMRHIRERLPIGTPNFRVFVNGNEVTTMAIPGKRIPVDFSTPYGVVTGEIILANLALTQRTIADAGVTIRVKQVSIMKSLFGFEGSHAIGMSRLRGSVNADFLPITSSRDRVIEDADEYRVVYVKMREYIQKALHEARKFAVEKENQQASQVLRDALDKIGRACKRNPDVLGEALDDPPVGFAMQGGGASEDGYVVSRAQFVDSQDPPAGMADFSGSDPMAPSNKPPPRRHMILANRAIIRKMKFRNLGIVCRMERFGPHYPPSFFEQGVIYFNIDHPLYQKQMDHPPLLTMFISTLIAKELVLQKHPRDASAAFSLQHQLLTDAFKDVRKL